MDVRTLVCRNQKYPWSAQNIQGFLQRKQGASPTEKLVCLYDALSFIEVNEFLIFVPQPFLKLTAAPHKHKPDIIPQTAVTDRNDSPTLELTESRISPPCQKPIRIPHTGRRYPRRACAYLLRSWSLKTRIAPLLSKSNQKTGRKFWEVPVLIFWEVSNLESQLDCRWNHFWASIAKSQTAHWKEISEIVCCLPCGKLVPWNSPLVWHLDVAL